MVCVPATYVAWMIRFHSLPRFRCWLPWRSMYMMQKTTDDLDIKVTSILTEGETLSRTKWSDKSVRIMTPALSCEIASCSARPHFSPNSLTQVVLGGETALHRVSWMCCCEMTCAERYGNRNAITIGTTTYAEFPAWYTAMLHGEVVVRFLCLQRPCVFHENVTHFVRFLLLH